MDCQSPHVLNIGAPIIGSSMAGGGGHSSANCRVLRYLDSCWAHFVSDMARSPSDTDCVDPSGGLREALAADNNGVKWLRERFSHGFEILNTPDGLDDVLALGGRARFLRGNISSA